MMCDEFRSWKITVCAVQMCKRVNDQENEWEVHERYVNERAVGGRGMHQYLVS